MKSNEKISGLISSVFVGWTEQPQTEAGKAPVAMIAEIVTQHHDSEPPGRAIVPFAQIVTATLGTARGDGPNEPMRFRFNQRLLAAGTGLSGGLNYVLAVRTNPQGTDGLEQSISDYSFAVCHR